MRPELGGASFVNQRPDEDPLSLKFGLRLPWSSELRHDYEAIGIEQDMFEGIFLTHLHEFQHVGATVALFDDPDEAFDSIKFVTAKPLRDFRGITLVSNALSDKSRLIYAAGMVDTPLSAAEGYGNDVFHATQKSHPSDPDFDPGELKAEAAKLLDSSHLTPSIRIRMAEMATYIQLKHGAKVVTGAMLRQMYRQAVLEEVEDLGPRLVKGNRLPTPQLHVILLDNMTLDDYLKDAERALEAFNRDGAAGLDAIAIVTDYIDEALTSQCPNCGAILQGKSSCGDCQN